MNEKKKFLWALALTKKSRWSHFIPKLKSFFKDVDFDFFLMEMKKKSSSHVMEVRMAPSRCERRRTEGTKNVDLLSRVCVRVFDLSV